jgi:hypothetical protein
MCIFCVGDDAPFHLRKSTAFPRRMAAEPAGSAFACESAEQASAQTVPQPALSDPARSVALERQDPSWPADREPAAQ